jgi:hypothetical protein
MLMIVTVGLVTTLLFSVNPVAAISIAVTGNTQEWTFTPGTNEYPTPLTVTVTTDKFPWTVNVKDALNYGKNASSAGRMLEYNATSGWVDTGRSLSQNMTVIGESSANVEGSSAILGPTDQLIETGSTSVTDKQMAITLQQPITYADFYLSNGNTYREVITFTVTEP